MIATLVKDAPSRYTCAAMDPELSRLLAFAHHDPHTLLGAHATDGGVVFRVLRPRVRSVTVVWPGATPLPMTRVQGDLFEATAQGLAAPPAAYTLRLEHDDGRTTTTRDPYSFAPTLGALDLHLFTEGRHGELWRKLGAHVREVDGCRGTAFAVWAPNASRVSVVGDFNGWDGRVHMMRAIGAGVWELFVPNVGDGALYKLEIRTADGALLLKADPFAQATEEPPATASRVFESRHEWKDSEYLRKVRARNPQHVPLSVYEVHLGSWRRGADGETLDYRESARQLAEYATWMGFTHVELMPVMEHPFGGSWGYQVTSYFAPTSRFGTPDDFRAFVDTLHAHGIGVILDWVPAHFPKDAFALGRFDGTALYEHADARQGEHPDWGTFVFNYGRHEVRNFLVASALYWLEEFHVDGLRVDAVASMLYLDYSRKEGEWVPNRHGGRENLDAISLLQELNTEAHARFPGVMMIAEESTAWGGVSRPVYDGGLGFTFKWNMGWMHDTLGYVALDPVYRQHHHHELTFSLVYAWTESFVLSLSHDEVVHGKGSLLAKMSGHDKWHKLGTLRALFGLMWAHPGRKLIFMGNELAQEREWSHDHSLDWHLGNDPQHRGIQLTVRALNQVYRASPALFENDSDASSFAWVDCHNASENVIAFIRRAASGDTLVCVCNFSNVTRERYRLGLPAAGEWEEVLNTDAAIFGGANDGNYGRIVAKAEPHHGQPASSVVRLPPVTTLWFRPKQR